MHRARLISYVFVTVTFTLNIIYASEILSLFGLTGKSLYYSCKYLRSSVWFVFMDVQFNTNFRYLNIMNRSYVNSWVMFISIIFHSLWCYIFITILDLDVTGAALSVFVSRGINASLSSGYLHYYNPHPESYFWINKECFIGWWEYLKFTFPSIILLCSEWLGFEIQAVIALQIPNGKYDYSAHIFLSNLNTIIFAFSLGFAISSAIMTGKYIAQGKVGTTKKVIKTVFIYGQTVMLFISIIYYMFGHSFLSVFTSDYLILEKAMLVIGIQAISVNFDMAQTVLSNSCRGLGKQFIASVISFLCYYVYALCTSIILTIYFEYRIVGIWISLSTGYAISSLIYAVLLFTFDYEEIKNETKYRLDRDINVIKEM